jgi:hypothetical protein
MSIALRILILVIGITFFLLVFELARKRKFREELSIIWLFVDFIIISLAFADYIIDPIAKYLKVHYPPMLLLVIVLSIFLIALFLFSLVISDLKTKNKELTQKIALIEFKLQELKKALKK